jgi:hypothetical protein
MPVTFLLADADISRGSACHRGDDAHLVHFRLRSLDRARKEFSQACRVGTIGERFEAPAP